MKILLTVALLFLFSGCIYYGVVAKGHANLIAGDGTYTEYAAAMIIGSLILPLWFEDMSQIKTWSIKRKIGWGIAVWTIGWALAFMFLIAWAFVIHWLK